MSALSFTEDPIPRLTRRIAVPISVGMLFNTLFNVVDTLCAGWLGTTAQAALSVSFPLFFAVVAVGSGISQGSTALLANALGAGDRDAARRIFAQTILFATVAGLALSAAGLVAAPPLFRRLGAEGAYLETALAYMNVILAGGVFLLLPMACNAALSAQGITAPYRNFLIAGCAANVVLNPALMWGWGGLPALGVAGIALSTVLVQAAGFAYLATLVARSACGNGFRPGEFRPHPGTLRKLAGQAVPATLNMLTIALGIFVMTAFVQSFGREAVAACGIATRIEQIVLLPVIGLSAALISIVGQNHGAGLAHRVRQAWVTNARTGVALMAAGGLGLALVREPAMRLFTADPVVAAHGADYLLAASCTLAAYPLLFVTVFALQGLKRPAYGLWMGLYRQLLAPVAVFPTLAFTLGWGLRGIWWGIFLVTWSAALFAVWYGWRQVRGTGSGPGSAPS